MSVSRIFRPVFNAFVNHPNLENTFASPIYRGFKLLEEDKHELLLNNNQILLQFQVPQQMCNFFGVAHGGALATIIDCATTLAILKADESRRLTTTVEISQHCLSPVSLNESVLIRAECIRLGKTVAFAQAEIFTKGNKVAVSGRQTKFILAKPWDHSMLAEKKE